MSLRRRLFLGTIKVFYEKVVVGEILVFNKLDVST